MSNIEKQTKDAQSVGSADLLTPMQCGIAADRLNEDSNVIARWYDANRETAPALVLKACTNEMAKLRHIAERLKKGMPKCPECGMTLTRNDDVSYQCPDECGYFHEDELRDNVYALESATESARLTKELEVKIVIKLNYSTGSGLPAASCSASVDLMSSNLRWNSRW